MRLFEFFGNIKHDSDPDSNPDTLGKEEERKIADAVFWHILDSDDLHKKHFLPHAKEIKAAHKKDDKISGHDWKRWLPMAKEGCLEYYKDKEVKGHPADTFTKEFFIELCKRLADHHHKDIIKGEYKI
jgi:hypothetical protein